MSSHPRHFTAAISFARHVRFVRFVRFASTTTLVLAVGCASDPGSKEVPPPVAPTVDAAPAVDDENTAPTNDDARTDEAARAGNEDREVVPPPSVEGVRAEIDEAKAVIDGAADTASNPPVVDKPSSETAEAAVDEAVNTPKRLTSFVHNRVIVKPNKGEALDADALKAFAAKATGQSVEEVIRGPTGVLLVVFSPVDPPRDDAAQKKLVETLSKSGRFKYVEADRMMTAR